MNHHDPGDLTDKQKQLADEIAADALNLPDSEQVDFVRSRCEDDRAIYEEVMSLLDYVPKAERRDLLEISPALPLVHPAQTDHRIGSMVGRYRITELLARGGMGVVYRAEQERPQRSVALKLIRGGFLSSELLRRFEIETQVLGQLQHPGIAQIFEAGTADSDEGPQPFFAMEYIEGLNLIEYAEREKLDLPGRLGLMIKIGEAVQHAHRKGVIHRDLKPANILVDREGQPRILDFGIARGTDADLQVTTVGSDPGLLIGTLPYMSPEQVQGRSDDLDTRSDVYSLGVVCYELLTDELPRDLKGKTITEAIREITESDPKRLSATGLNFPGDLETIVAKALEGDRDERYDTASELNADLRRFLDDEPISAHPPSAAYQLRKFARRNRALVTGSAIALLALILGVIGTTSGWVKAVRAEETARSEGERARVVSDFLREMLIAPSPYEHGGDVRVIDLLSAAQARIEEEFSDKPILQATLLEAIGEAYSGLDLLDEADPLLRRAVEIHEGLEGPSSAEHIHAMSTLVSMLGYKGALEEAIELGRRAVELAELHLEPDDPARLSASHQLATALDEVGQWEEAERLYRETLEASLRIFGPEHRDTLATQSNLGSLLRMTDRRDEALKILQEVYEKRCRLLGEEAFDSLITLNNLAFINFELDRFDEADRMFRRSFELREKVLGPDHRSTAIALNNIGWSLVDQQRGDEALPYLRDAVKRLHAALGPEHHIYAVGQMNLADALFQTGAPDEAEPLLLAALPRIEAWVGPEDPRTLRAMSLLVKVYAQTGRLEKAQPYLDRLKAAVQD